MNLVYGRIESILKYCVNKDVLDLGCSHHDLYEDRIMKHQWLHSRICQVARSVVGIDYLGSEVKKLRRLGYNVILGNVEELYKLNLGRKFDTIVAGELIEHLFNPGLFLDSVKTLMNDDTKLIITTPNVYAYHRIKLILNRRFEEHWLNPEHVCWYSFQTLKQLLLRKEFSIEFEGYYTSIERKERNLKNRIKTLLNYKRYREISFSDGLFFIVSNRKIYSSTVGSSSILDLSL